MELMFGIFTVLGGAAYILWQAHKESPGLIGCTLVFVLMYCVPLLLVGPIAQWNLTAGIIYSLIYLAIVIGWCVYMACGGSEKAIIECVEESARIWAEVDRLPKPDEATLTRIKIANRIPIRPSCKSYDDAALNIWRTNEYNKRLKEKHRLVCYVK